MTRKKATRKKRDELRSEYDFEALGPSVKGKYFRRFAEGTNLVLLADALRMAAELRPREILPRCVSSKAARTAQARGRQFQRCYAAAFRLFTTTETSQPRT